MTGSHWHQTVTDDIVLLTLDVQGQSANTLSTGVLDELDALIQDIAKKIPRGLVINSAKPSGFIAGADVKEFQTVSDPKLAEALARKGQQAFDRIAGLPCRTVAVIHGHCLGGGMELALACDYRVAREDEGTRLGLPEVRLGIHPGFGGTVRLPPLIGDLAALDLMLSGRSVSARSARRMGLVDEIVPERHLLSAATAMIQNGRKRSLSTLKKLPGWAPLRPLVAGVMKKQVRKRALPEHYPAPYRIIQLWLQRAGLEQEAASLGELLVGHTSRNLVRVFLLGEDLKHAGKQAAHEIKHVHVVGAGVMGGDIAAWSAFKGFRVTLQDRHAEAIARAMSRAYRLYKKKLKNPRDVEAAMDRLVPDLHGHGLRHSDLVIEAVVENEKIKQDLFRDMESKVDGSTILATNTSSIPLEIIGEALKDPSRLVGLHFFNPVAKMQLVEIVQGKLTSDVVLGRARAFTTAISRLPLDVKSSPGFLVNRILMPYLMEAVTLVDEGVKPGAIDQAAIEFGMPMGPIHLADTVGLDICLSVAQELAGPLGMAVPERLEKMVEAGNLGKKSGRGFYTYNKKGQPNRMAMGHTHVPVADRLVMRLLNEATACLREGVVETVDAVDAGMVYGTGFAPFYGGPMHYIHSRGPEKITHTLYRLTEDCGKRFQPDPGWSQPDLLD